MVAGHVEKFRVPPASPGPIEIEVTYAERQGPVEADFTLFVGRTQVTRGRGKLSWRIPDMSSEWSVLVQNTGDRPREYFVDIRYWSQREIVEQRIPIGFFRRKFDEFVNRRKDELVHLR